MTHPFSIVLRLIILPVVFLLSACSGEDLSAIGEEPQIGAPTQSQRLLEFLPPAGRKIVLSVYDFQDKTGQHKPNDAYAEYSRAVTQGGAAMLYKALLDAGKQQWFQVIEREGLENLLQERKIIRAMREQYRKADGSALPDVGPMLYAGVLLEGGIVSYESNMLTGGIGARYLGIGGDTQYRQDIVTVYLRLVSVQSGEVLLSVNTSKTIYSALLRGSVFKFIGINELLEVESGFTLNEPPQFAVRQAIEMAVYSLIMEGAKRELWSFRDTDQGRLALMDYEGRKQGRKTPVRDYAMMAQLARQQQEQRRAVAPPSSGAAPPIVPVMSAPPPPSPNGAPVPLSPVAPLPAVVAPPSGAEAVRGQAQIPPGTQYVPEAADVPEERRRPIYSGGENEGNGNGGAGLYDYRVYCTKSGCRAVGAPP